MTELVLAHLSDPHLTHLGEVRGRELLSKRVLGYLSWRTHRRHVHRSEVLDALLTDTARRTEMGERARERSAQFSWDTSAARFEAVLESAVGATKTPPVATGSRRRRRKAYRP